MPYGAQLKFGIARQAAVGSGGAVTAATSFHHIALLSHDIGLEKQEVVSQNLNGSFEQGATYDGTSNIAGTLEVEATPKALGALLTALVGLPTITSSASLRNLSYYPRTADYSSTLINEPHTIYAQLTDSTSAELYFDCQFGQVDFQFAQGQLLRTRASVMGGRRVQTGVASMGITLDNTDLSMGWLWDTASVTLGGTAISNFTDLTVSINDNIQPLYTINGSLLPYKYTRSGFREVTVSGTILFDSRSMYNDFIGGTQRQLKIDAFNTRSTIQSGYYPYFGIDVPQMKITQMKPSVGGPGEVSVNFTARGVTDPSSRYAVRFFLTNTWGGVSASSLY